MYLDVSGSVSICTFPDKDVVIYAVVQDEAVVR